LIERARTSSAVGISIPCGSISRGIICGTGGVV
jgi:hypothetical protein